MQSNSHSLASTATSQRIDGPLLHSQLNLAAKQLADTGDFVTASQYYEQIVALDPDNGPAWTALGHCYLLTDERKKAFTAYQKAIYSLPDIHDPQLWYGIGRLYEKVPFVSYWIV